MNVDSTAGAVNFKLGTNLHDGQLLIGSGGYHSGILTLKAYGQIGANVIDLSAMDHNAKLILGSDLVLEGDLIGPDVHTTLYANCHFKGDVTLPKVEIWSGSTTFDGKAELTLTRYNISVGNNMFKDTTIINAASAQGNTQRLGTALADTFLAPVTFNMIRNMSLYIANSSTGNYFADAVTLHNSGNTSSYFYIGGNTSSSAKFGGDIILEVDSTSGGITFYRGSNEHTGDMMIGSSGYHSGQLKLDAYTQTAVGTIDLTTMDHNSSLSVQTNADITADFLFAGGNTATLNGAIFRGDVDIETSSMPVTNCTFYGTTVLEKTGGVNNQNYGNNFYGATTIENSSTANYVYWGYNTTDTFYTDLTLINHSTQPLWMNYNTQGEYAGDITLQGDSAKVIRFGNTTAGQISVFNGSTDQTLSITQYLDVQAYRIEVNKSGGRLKLTDDLSVSKELKLTDGIIECQDSTVLTLADGVEPPATDSSYVEGPVKKIGNDAYTFPVGTNGHYRPIGISAPSNATDAFTAEHINEDSDPTYEHDDKEGSINEIGTNEYWMLERTVGTSDITVTLSWDDMSCGFDTLANLRVVAWKDTIWKDLGNGGTTGDTDAGTIVGSGASTIYGAYALATIDTFRCVPCRADAGEDKVIYSGYDAIVGVSAISGMTYLWSPNERIIDNSSSTTTVYPKSETVYTVTATNSQGCEASDSVFIETIALKRWPQCIGGN
jgi:hypothetical protein